MIEHWIVLCSPDKDVLNELCSGRAHKAEPRPGSDGSYYLNADILQDDIYEYCRDFLLTKEIISGTIEEVFGE